MKQLFLSAALLVIGFVNAQVKIGNNPTTINPATLLELNTNSRGFLPPRMTECQRNNIAAPVPEGLIVYCTNCGINTGQTQQYNGTGWVNMIGSPASPAIQETIGTQVWTVKNLEVTKYRNGDIIPQVTDPTAWAALTTGAWSYFNNDLANGAIYGKLYNWYAVNDPRGLAPIGYHVPTDDEWTTLITFLGGDSVAGGKMKSTGTSLWNSINTDATNSSCFTGFPGGYFRYDGEFLYLGNAGYWWSSTVIDTLDSRFYYLNTNDGSATRANSNKRNGFSIRCLKD